VQVAPIEAKLKAPGTKRLKLRYHEPLSKFAFKSNLRRYSTVARFAQELLLEKGVSLVLHVKPVGLGEFCRFDCIRRLTFIEPRASTEPPRPPFKGHCNWSADQNVSVNDQSLPNWSADHNAHLGPCTWAVLARLARCTGAAVAAAADALTEGSVGVCGEFSVETTLQEHEPDPRTGAPTTKTLMTFSGCPAVGLGCTVLLRGGSMAQLAVGLGGYFSPRHRMPFKLINERSNCV
jgi:hypothetical protein